MRGPFAFIPAPAENPFVGRGRGGPLLDPLDDFFLRGNVFEIQPDKTLAEINQVGVGVDDAGQDRCAVKIHGVSGPRIEALRFLSVADPKDAPAPDSDGLRGGLLLVHGHHVGIKKKQVGVRRLRGNF